MKCKQICFLAILALLSLASCKKDTITYPISGVWIGTYTVDNIPSQKALFYSFSIFPDGSITVKGKGDNGKDQYAAGTWLLTGSAFSAAISAIGSSGTPVQQSLSASFSNTGTLTNGTWKDTDNPYTTPNAGKFSTMQRVN